ncbi:hypothetical protein GF407_05305 [candidate division KSB1 bacterium]|nr:hypothetical protein [candidate division KSB1 bacterium]
MPAVLSIRTGKGYTGPAEGATHYKFLAHPHGRWSREETRIKKIQYWNKNHTCRFKVVWTRSRIHLYLDNVLQASFHFEGQIEPFRYIFIEKGATYGVDNQGVTSSIINADVDNDGNLDLCTAQFSVDNLNYKAKNRLFVKQTSGAYRIAADSLGLEMHSTNTQSAVVLDIEGDGDLDLYQTNWGEANEMYINDGSGFFHRGIRGCEGPAENSNFFGQLGSTAADVDNDD